MANMSKCRVAHDRRPYLRLLAHTVDVQGASSLQEDVYLLSLDLASRGQHLAGEHEGKDDLVALKQATLNVQVDLIRHVVNDVVDTLAGQRSLLTVVNGQLVQLVELVQGGLVHAVDH